ncbi:MAG: patatin-like phospholipase family protein [Rubrivivax sp.]
MPTVHRNALLVDLALQGGGAHGAFTWGVLDRLVEEPWLTFDGISGTSAGAMNAAVMASGHAHGGADGAKAALEDFWKRVSDASKFSPMRRGPMEMLTGQWTLDYSPMYLAAEMASRIFSPYDLNPLGNNPLSPILAEMVDFEALAHSPIKLFITATNVRTGAGHVFRNAQITPDVLLASGCLPTMFQAVEIEGEFYWDGGYSGNPTITPLVRECDSHDTILVQINPIVRNEVPRSARDIMNRLNEVSFNAPLLKELRMIALLHQVADPGRGEGASWAAMRLHRIATDRVTELTSSSKMITEWPFLCGLRDEGRRTAQLFLDAHAGDLGKRSTVDLDALLATL